MEQGIFQIQFRKNIFTTSLIPRLVLNITKNGVLKLKCKLKSGMEVHIAVRHYFGPRSAIEHKISEVLHLTVQQKHS